MGGEGDCTSFLSTINIIVILYYHINIIYNIIVWKRNVTVRRSVIKWQNIMISCEEFR